MSGLTKVTVLLILQFLEESNFKETARKLEQESGVYFNMKYFEREVLCGNWDQVEKYLGAFTKVFDNGFSKKLYFEIRLQKYLEALDKRDLAKAAEILVKDLKVFAPGHENLYKDLALLLTLENFRESENLSKYTDTMSARAAWVEEFKTLIKKNPLFSDKLQFPALKSRTLLRSLIYKATLISEK